MAKDPFLLFKAEKVWILVDTHQKRVSILFSFLSSTFSVDLICFKVNFEQQKQFFTVSEALTHSYCTSMPVYF